MREELFTLERYDRFVDGFRSYLKDSSVADRKLNSIFSGVVSVYLLVNCFNLVLDGSLTWSVYSLLVLVLVFIPPVYFEDRSALVPFEVLILLALPFTLKGMELGFAASHTLSYFSAATVSLLLVTELDTFTSFRTNSFFSVLFVSFTTIAVSGMWAVGRWLSDVYLGTGFITSNEVLMWEFSAALLAGLVAGIFFNYYLKLRVKEVEKSDQG